MCTKNNPDYLYKFRSQSATLRQLHDFYSLTIVKDKAGVMG